MQSIHLALFVGAALLFVGLLLGTLSTRVGVPSLLVFLVVGMLAGEDGIGGIQFQDFELGFLVSNLALAIILLDGGLRTRLSTFRAGLKPALTLATLGVLLTAMSVGAFATWLLGIDWRLGLLLGGIIGSTDAAAVFNVIKGAGLRLNERVESTLEIESGLNDPMAIFITVLLIDLLTLPDAKWGLETLVVLIQQFGLGALLGVALGAGLSELLLRVRSNEGLHALLLCTGGAAIFSLTNMVGGSGFLAVYLVGLIAGNRRAGTSDNVLRSMDSMAWLAQSGMFLLLGLLVTPAGLITSLLPGLMIALFLTFIARPVAVWISLLPFAFSNREKTFIAWTGLRGAVPIVLAVFPLLAGVPENRLLFDITFVVVLTSLLLQGTSIGFVARRMRVALPPAASPLAAVALEGAEDQFLVQFRIQAGSRAEGKTMDQVAFPGVQPIALVRGGVSLNLADNPVLQANDLLTWLTSHAEQEQLGEWFLATTATLRRFYGDFTVRATARVSDVAMSYGLTGLSPAVMGMTLEELFHQRHKGTPVVGDTIELGGIRLRVRSLERGQVHQVGIRLPKT